MVRRPFVRYLKTGALSHGRFSHTPILPGARPWQKDSRRQTRKKAEFTPQGIIGLRGNRPVLIIVFRT